MAVAAIRSPQADREVDHKDVRSNRDSRHRPVSRDRNREEDARAHADRLALALHDRRAVAQR